MRLIPLLKDSYYFFKRRFFLILWISLVTYIFYNTYMFYFNGRQFYYIRRILGLGLCISRGTASVINLCCALVLLPLCKKLNQVLYRILSKLWPNLFFFWLERAKSFHMTVAVTLVMFALVHSVSHFVNLWNFSRSYDERMKEINFAKYKNESPFFLLLSQPGLTGVSMLIIILLMGMTSMRVVRRNIYNAFWYTHQLYMLFIALLIVHPLSGVLKEEILDDVESSPITSHEEGWSNSSSIDTHKFISIRSKTWTWMAFPLGCFLIDLVWRISSRNRARVHILEVPTSNSRNFVVWVRVKGDWTEHLERLLLENGANRLSFLVDGAFSSPMEGAAADEVALCVAAGVGITPFVSLLHHMLLKPRTKLPGRIHLLWIVRTEEEITWLADLANDTILQLRDANRPDRLHIEFYVTGTKGNDIKAFKGKEECSATHMVVINEKGKITHALSNNEKSMTDDEKASLLTPNRRRHACTDDEKRNNLNHMKYYEIAKEYPLLGCRLKRGRPHWDRVFGYWVHLYPHKRLNLYCCGTKKLVKSLKNKCKYITSNTKTKITIVHERFS
ncbi:NADPH oxidase 4-like isoform X2 [Galleria mellonella]|uniref:NADPH oxidase 4-like isoform X2 n=1 Tax=Galleria mellonella TaxID=7137 RepID=A0ABM3MF80_GALME|nr:NADPH oxidase 4-like isoform X2 [Galleria mellonella]